MKTSLDKLQSGVNDIIQIIVSPASCDIFLCSNCTQLLPFRKDKEFMDLDVFRRAVRSLRDWPGIVALFGGNPVSHPKFVQLVDIMIEEIPDQRHRGLWTNNLIDDQRGEAARRLVWPHGRVNLNVHTDKKAADLFRKWLPKMPILGEYKKSWHSPIMMSHHDFGISYDEWTELRESCDINQRWSAAVVQRTVNGVRGAYAYFCEVAAALDGIRQLNHGVPVEDGWWRWTMEKFQHQVVGCCDAGCGVPLRLKGHLDLDFTYDISKSFSQYAKHNFKKLRIVRHETLPESTEIPTDYQEQWSKK